MKRIIALLLIMCGVPRLLALPAEVIIIRHGEEPPNVNAIHLSARGQQRARALVAFFTTNPGATQNGRPAVLFAPKPTPHSSIRSRETLQPTARRLGLRIQEPFVASGYASLARQILHSPAFNGKTIAIAWVHTYIPQFASALGVKNAPKNWNSSSFDRAYIITFPNGKATLKDIPQRLLPGDSKK